MERGIALVAVLSVLVLLAVMAASFAVVTQIEQASSRVQVQETQAGLLVESAFAHAQAVIYAGVRGGEVETSLGLLSEFLETVGGTGRWYEVRDSRGAAIGGYRFHLEDEAGKVNLNTGCLLGASRGSGWTTGEINLPLALGLPTRVCEALLHYRYGANRVPGARGDDDGNNMLLMNDGIDNDADGVVDEEDEGVEDPGEYRAYAPRGDDRAFSGMSEVVGVIMEAGGREARERAGRLRHELPRRVTLLVHGERGEVGDGARDVNAMTVREVRRVVGRAQRETAFGATQRALNQLAVNIVDYRDENHVLSTLGSQYGVEAVNFNEVLANDGTVAFNTAPATVSHSSPTDRDFMMSHYALWNHEGDAWQLDKSRWAFSSGQNYCPWDVEVLDRRRVRLLGPAIRFTSADTGTYFMDSRRQLVYRRYREMRRGSAYPPTTITAERNGYRYTYEGLTWPENMFRNASIILVQTRPNSLTPVEGNSPRVQEILGSTRDGVLHLATPITFDYTTNVTRGLIFGWAGSGYAFCAQPRVPLMLTFQGLQPRKYYLPIANNWSSHYTPHVVARAGFGPWEQIWADDRRPQDHKLTYGGETTETCEPVRTDREGVVHIFYISGSDARFNPAMGYSAWNTVWGVTFMRPEVIELYNASTRAISLRNWVLTFNTGSVVNDIGVIEWGRGYSLQPGRADSNPVIEAGGYFYLVNNVKLFNAEFGSKVPSATWGVNASQEIPVWEIPNRAWGVQYEIEKAVPVGTRPFDIRIHVKQERWRPNQFRGEVVEFVNTTAPEERKGCAHGCRYMVLENTRNTLTIDINVVDPRDATHYEPSGYVGSGVGVNRVMILGMPAKGGVVSMTLKNEYKQIVARTVDYSYLEREPDEWYGASAEKRDPTQYEWEVRRRPSIGGRREQARNVAQRGGAGKGLEIKNGPYVSVGELRRVRTEEAFRTLGDGHKAGRQSALAGIASLLETAGVRLEACDPQVERRGWRMAVGTVARAQGGTIVAEEGGWEAGQWRGHTLRFLTGALRGERYPIFDNTATSIELGERGTRGVPRSAPGRKPLQPGRGDRFSLGPGYSTPLCYAREPGESGEWLWRRVVPVRGRYHLYLFGLNDAIATTEFLEENHNAALDVAVWNWEEDAYETLVRGARYDKADCIRVGLLKPAHVSREGDFRLQLVARDVGERGEEGARGVARAAPLVRKTGYAWFHYALITPVPVAGRVNVNTAPARVLEALPGMSRELAQRVVAGRGGRGGRLRPYRSHAELLQVEGMTPEIFERVANLIQYNSGVYTVEACGEVRGNRGVEAQTSMRCLVVHEEGRVVLKERCRR